MIIPTRSGRFYNTETELNAPERHILQKLFIWESMASSLGVFRQKKEEALLKGWNYSGPIREGEVLKSIIADLEEKIFLRLKEETKTTS
jgi:hypothetical protein